MPHILAVSSIWVTLSFAVEYVTGDRFSPEFMERRRLEYVCRIIVYGSNSSLCPCSLHRFLQRLARHPTLQRSTLLRAFFESTEWVCVLLSWSANPNVDNSTSICTNMSPILPDLIIQQV